MTHILFVETSTSGAGDITFAYAKEQGYTLSLLTANPDEYPASLLAYVDHVQTCDTQDYQAIESNILALNQQNPIHGITTTADLFVPQASFAANLLKLPGISHQAAIKARFKHLTRQTLDKIHPELNPDFAVVTDLKQAQQAAKEMVYPFIAKPSNANDSIHVKLIHQEADLSAYFDTLSQLKGELNAYQMADEVLLESYLDGPEFSVETVQAAGGERQLLGVTFKGNQADKNAGFAETSVMFPYQGEYQARLVDKVFQALDAMQIDCGVIHTECRVVQGKVKILEVNPRLIGDSFGSHAMVLALGVNPAHLVVDVALGQFQSLPKRLDKGVGWFALTTQESGIFDGFSNLADVKNQFQIEHLIPRKQVGDQIQGVSTNGDILALVICQGDNAELALDKAKRASQSIQYKLR